MKNGEERFLEYINEQTYIELSKEENISKTEIIKWGLELGISDISNSQNGITYLDIYNKFKHKSYGIHPSRFENKFKVNSYQRRKMIETGFIKVAYYKEEEIYPGRFEKVPFFNPKWYFNLNVNDIEEWRINNIKGYGKEQLKLDI
jgi:hypothetical protein